MPLSGGTSKAGDQLSQPSSERAASAGDALTLSDSDSDSDTEILETNETGRYQKMIDQVGG